jgi:hypothetical protein
VTFKAGAIRFAAGPVRIPSRLAAFGAGCEPLPGLPGPGAPVPATRERPGVYADEAGTVNRPRVRPASTAFPFSRAR